MRTVLFFSCLLLAVWVSAQDPFEGSVDYTVEYLSLPEHLKDSEAMLGHQLRITCSGQKMRLEQLRSGRTGQVVLKDFASGEQVVLMEIFGMKVALVGPIEAVDSTRISAVEVQEEIAGELCKGVALHSGDEKRGPVCLVTDRWLSPDPVWQAAGGFPLEFSMTEGEMTLKATAQNIAPQEIKPGAFDVPEDYARMTAEAFQTLVESFAP